MKRMAATVITLLSCSVSAVPEVVVTTSQLADVTRNVSGELVNVTALMGPGVDPHLYRATPRDVNSLQNADLILYHGLSLEGQLAEVLGRFAELRPTAAIAEEAITADQLLESDQDGLTYDPHVWMDALLFSQTAPVIASHLAGIDPTNADRYRDNAAEYVEQLELLHDWIRISIDTIPPETRVLVTAHDAFTYYGRAYGIDVAAIQGLSTEAEAGVADIRETAELIIAHSVPAVFIESTVNPRTIQAVLEAVHDAGTATAIGGELYSDAMGSDDEFEGTLIGMLIHNTTAITSALGGQLPPLPPSLNLLLESWQQQ